MALTISRTAPFRLLQSRIGSATYRLNTLLVGLESIAAGIGQNGAIAVTWSKPSTPQKAREVADQARIFACSSALTLAADVLDTFITDIVREEWLQFSEQTKTIATKSKTRTKAEGGEYSLAERARAVCVELYVEQPILISSLDLLAKWRNVMVHSRDRKPRIDAGSESILKSSSQYFYENYKHLDISLALQNFGNRKAPVAKEVTSLIAMAVNLSRAIDEAAIRRMAATTESAEQAAFTMMKAYFKDDPERHLRPRAELAEMLQGAPERRGKQLLKVFANLGVNENSSPVSAPLPATFIDGLAKLDTEAFAEKFDIAQAS